MKNNRYSVVIPIGQFRYWLLLLTLLFGTNAWGGECQPAGHHDIDHEFLPAACPSDADYLCSYAARDGGSIPSGTEIGTIPFDDAHQVTWNFDYTDGCSLAGDVLTCSSIGMTVTLPTGVVNTDRKASITGASVSTGEKNIAIRVTRNDDTNLHCTREYKLHVNGSGGGWGDPHITTVDGVNYDFQSAGEFVSLRGKGLEIQTRQTAVSKQSVLRENPYTGIASCVSIYTAVAAKVGGHRVTIQPNLSGGVSDPSGVQLRVDGKLRVLGPDGIDLPACDCDSDSDSESRDRDDHGSCDCDSDSDETEHSGRIVKSADDKGFEIHYADGTKLVVTPAWWAAQQKWYMNVNIYDTTATKGIMGRITNNWLPALSNGKSVGERAGNPSQRYLQLYKTFADSWRVGNETNPSLFDYAAGTSTATFTMAEWPRENPPNCIFEGPDAVPADESVTLDESVAKEHCRDVEDENNRANCIIDVAATGHTGFADAYVRTEQVTPGATKTSLSVDQASSRPGTNVTFTAVVMRKLSTSEKVTSGRVQFVLDGTKVSDPVALDSNGNALWSTSNLQRGTHQIEARYLPSGFGEQFRASNSLKASHSVFMPGNVGLSFHLGTNAPHGSLSNNFDGDIGYAFDVEYRLNNSYSLLVFAGKNQFDSSTAELDITNLSINGKHYYGRLAKRRLRYFANGGIGFYMADPGDDDLGVNIGGGVQYQLAAGYGLEAWYNYHHIFSSPSSTDFSTLQFGGYYHF